MKYFVKFFVVTLTVFICTYAVAEQKVAFLDMTYILNKSKAGEGAQDYLKKKFKENQKKFADKEIQLKKEENDLLQAKASLTKEEYQKKATDLRKKVASYQTERRESLEKLAKQRTDAKAQLIKKLDPILESFLSENSISIIVDKKHVVKGDNQLDITKQIVEKLDKELPSINLN